MKKIYGILMCLLLVATMAVTAMADGELSASAAADNPSPNRGGQIEVVVAVSGGNAKSGGLQVSYSEASLELVSGTFLLTGTTLSDFSVAEKDGVFLFSDSQAISGDVLKCVFKVKEDAPFSATDIHFSVTAGSQTTQTKATVTVVCVHNFGGWISDGEHTHTHTCTTCNGVETVEHTWNDGEITTAPTCTAEGVKTYTCSGCGAQKTETVAMVEHAWDSGTVTKKTSCTEEGEMTYKCTAEGCAATKTEPIAKAKHKYDNSCDTTCNVCGGERQTSHKYSEKWTSDESGHWHECTVCGHRKDEAAHKPGSEPTEQTSQNCTVCGYIIKEALGHTHDYQLEWSTDAAGHWHACTGCQNQSEYEEHQFDNTCDKDCNICGYQRETEHIYYENYLSGDQGHWHECRVCGYQLEMEHHTPNEDGMCTACGYKTVAADHTHGYEGPWDWDASGHWQTCECGENSAVEPHSWDEGKIAKKPTDTEDGARIYKCTVCGAEKTELIPMGTVITDSFPWVVLLIVGGVAIVGVVVYVVIGIVSSRKKSGRFSGESVEENAEEE